MSEQLAADVRRTVEVLARIRREIADRRNEPKREPGTPKSDRGDA
jgi:hypothetical protein